MFKSNATLLLLLLLLPGTTWPRGTCNCWRRCSPLGVNYLQIVPDFCTAAAASRDYTAKAYLQLLEALRDKADWLAQLHPGEAHRHIAIPYVTLLVADDTAIWQIEAGERT
jgi:hypothetical protein